MNCLDVLSSSRRGIRIESAVVQYGPSIQADVRRWWGVVQLVGRCTVNADGGGSNPPAPAILHFAPVGRSGRRAFYMWDQHLRRQFCSSKVRFGAILLFRPVVA